MKIKRRENVQTIVFSVKKKKRKKHRRSRFIIIEVGSAWLARTLYDGVISLF